jgi:molecular chaperone GrpE
MWRSGKGVTNPATHRKASYEGGSEVSDIRKSPDHPEGSDSESREDASRSEERPAETEPANPERQEREPEQEQAAASPTAEGDTEEAEDAGAEPREGEEVEVVVEEGEAAESSEEPGGVEGDEQKKAYEEAERLTGELAAVEEERDSLRQALAEAKERVLRGAADMENLRKRTRREIADSSARGKQEVVSEMLPVIDNLERALDHAAQQGTLDSMTEGVDLVLRQFVSAMSKLGVEGFSAKGEPFDPAFHEAVGQVESRKVPPGTVLEEWQKGYKMGDKLIRPAVVVVSKEPPEEQSGEAEQGAAEQPEQGDEPASESEAAEQEGRAGDQPSGEVVELHPEGESEEESDVRQGDVRRGDVLRGQGGEGDSGGAGAEGGKDDERKDQSRDAEEQTEGRDGEQE